MEAIINLIKPPKRTYEDLSFVFCGYSETQRNHSYGPSIRDVYLIHLVTQGSGYYTINGNKYLVKRGQGFLIPPKVSTFYQSSEADPWHYIWMGLSGKMVHSYVQELGLNSAHLSFNIQRLDEFKALIFQCFAYEADSPLNEIRLQQQAYAFMALMYQTLDATAGHVTTMKMNPYVTQILAAINAAPYGKLTVADLAAQVSLNPSHLSRLFRGDMGLSIKQYIDTVRIHGASDLLVTTSETIAQISDKLGFASIQAFSKAFRQHTGYSPSSYRKQYLGLHYHF